MNRIEYLRNAVKDYIEIGITDAFTISRCLSPEFSIEEINQAVEDVTAVLS